MSNGPHKLLQLIALKHQSVQELSRQPPRGVARPRSGDPRTRSCGPQGCVKGIPKCFLAKCLREACVAKAKQPHILQKIMVCWCRRLRRQGHKTICFLKMCGGLASVPQASQKTLGQTKHFRIPLSNGPHKLLRHIALKHQCAQEPSRQPPRGVVRPRSGDPRTRSCGPQGCQRDPEVVFWSSDCWRPALPRTKNHTFSRK